MGASVRATASRLFLSLILATTATFAARAETGVTATEVLVGMSNAQSGPASALGTKLKAGAQAYFAKVNAAGGVHGRRIKLVSYDDGYEPDRAVAMTGKLIDEDKVFTLFGYVGTPTSSAVLPLVSKAGIPYVAPFTGAELLRTPVNRVVFNVRASYFDETEAMVERLTRDLGVRKIGVFIQDDAYGNAGKAGVMRALVKNNLTLVGEGKYKRNTTEIDSALAALKQAAPEAVVMVGTYKACAAFVKQARAAGFRPRFLNVSFVGTSDFIKEAGADAEGVYITQVMPSPDDAALPLVKQYQADMKAADGAETDYTSLEGYLDAVVLVEALRKAGPGLTRASFIGALEGMQADLGGVKVEYSPRSHQGLKGIFHTVVRGGRPVPVQKY
ncbi:MAG: Amino acid/amide transporter substrate-binding protein family [Ramlibacter sp.]|nr:Amino acid/amide transporter substrate-binding protein family [Ramlibacter sp.]